MLKNKSKPQNYQVSFEQLQSVLDSSYDGFLLTDASGKVLMVNQAYFRLTGLPSDMVGHNMQEFIDQGYMHKSVALLVLEEKKTVTTTHTDMPGGTIIVTGNPIFDDNGQLCQVVTNVRDMTEIYQLREELEKAQEMEKRFYSHFDKYNDKDNLKGAVVVSGVMREVFSLARKISTVDVTALILGESGVGKEVIAHYIHDNSPRKNGPFITINCGAIPEQLLESELFGYMGGAFTGAMKNGKAGLFEAAQEGTLFLDEIGELPLNLQVKILRALETHEITRIGSCNPLPINVRILAATNRNLEEMVERETFREDLYYRLNVIQIPIPPLRERCEDIAPLSMHFLSQYNKEYVHKKRMTYDVLKDMEQYKWPGNIRELKNVIERMVVVSSDDYLQTWDLPWYSKVQSHDNEAVKVNRIVPLLDAIESVEKQILACAVQEYKSSRKIARIIGIDQSTVVRKLKKYGLNK